jgi:hypothetical protein
MKNLSKIFMLIGFVAAAIAMILNIVNDQSWCWQGITMLWIINAYINEKTADRYRNLIDKMSK